MVANSSSFLLLPKISFKNFAYLGIYEMASTKGIFTWSCLRSSKNFEN